MDYDVFVYKKDDCIYDFVYVAAPDSDREPGSGTAAFERFVASFHALTGRTP
jgi:hypothetical protein